MKNLQLLLVTIAIISCNTEPSFKVGQIKTPKGEILLWLYDETPKHKESFIQLANDGYWDSLSFNRVIPNFVAQGGCPDTPEILVAYVCTYYVVRIKQMYLFRHPYP